jgi:hypothetical protein
MTMARKNDAALVKPSPGGLPSLEKARAILAQCRTVNEVQKVKALAQAVATCAAAEGARSEAAAIVLLARARRGEIVTALPKAKHGGKGGGSKVQGSDSRKQDVLAKEGLSKQTAVEDQRIAALKGTGELDVLIETGATTAVAALALQRLPPEKRKRVLRKVKKTGGDVKKAIGEVKLEDKDALAEELRAKPVPAGALGPFDVIVIDPPWQYEKRAEDITHRGRNPYPDMTVEQICDPERVPLVKLAASDCILWLWTTHRFLPMALRLLDAWRLRYVCTFVWHKPGGFLGGVGCSHFVVTCSHL